MKPFTETYMPITRAQRRVVKLAALIFAADFVLERTPIDDIGGPGEDTRSHVESVLAILAVCKDMSCGIADDLSALQDATRPRGV